MKITLKKHIEISELEGWEDDAIGYLTIFDNPKYFEAIKQKRSVRLIDPKIYLLAYDEDDNTIVPVGFLQALLKEFPDYCEVVDQRNTHPVNVPFSGTLRPYQETFITDAIKACGGVLVAPTGAGKTVSAIALASRLKQRCLILVKSGDLATQWVDAIKQFTGLDCGLIGGGKNTEGLQFTVGLVQSLVKRDLSALDYGLVIADECHNAPANQFYTVINGLDAKYKYGLSATPQRRDSLEFMITAALGEIVSEIKQSDLDGKVLPVRIETINHDFEGYPESWTQFINILIDDDKRNEIIINLAKQQTRPTIILCSQVRHCEILTTLAQQAGLQPLIIHGGLPAKLRSERMTQAHNARLVIGTSQLLSEGIDIPSLEVLIFASPMSAVVVKQGDPAATKLIQSIGRCRRPYRGKVFAKVYDIIDRCGFGVSAYRKRAQIYNLQGWSIF